MVKKYFFLQFVHTYIVLLDGTHKIRLGTVPATDPVLVLKEKQSTDQLPTL